MPAVMPVCDWEPAETLAVVPAPSRLPSPTDMELRFSALCVDPSEHLGDAGAISNPLLEPGFHRITVPIYLKTAVFLC